MSCIVRPIVKNTPSSQLSLTLTAEPIPALVKTPAYIHHNSPPFPLSIPPPPYTKSSRLNPSPFQNPPNWTPSPP